MLYGMGITRHSKEDIISFIAEASKAMSVIVGEKGFLDGRVCSANAILFGMLVGIQEAGEMTPTWNAEIGKYPNLMKWVEDMKIKYFPERVT